MESIEQKAKLIDERIEQLKSLIHTTGQFDQEVYVKSLEQENTELKTRIQSLMNESVLYKNEREVTQHYNFMNNVSKTSAQSTGQSEQPGDETGATGEQQGYKSRKGWRPREGNVSKPAVNTAIDISRFDLRVGRVLSVQKHPDADTLYVEQIDVGEEKPRTICSALVQHMPMNELDQSLVIVMCNLKPIKMRGILSQGMLMCASLPVKDEVLRPPSDAQPGDRVICPGYNCSSPDAEIKRLLCDQILLTMYTNDKGEATSQGTLWKIANRKGPIKAKTLFNIPIR